MILADWRLHIAPAAKHQNVHFIKFVVRLFCSKLSAISIMRDIHRLLLIKKRLLLMKKKRRRQRASSRRRLWIHPINQRRAELGHYNRLVQELRLDDERHRRYFRMSPNSFDYILSLITPHVTKEDTVMREAIPPGLKLAVTLQFLAEGSTYNHIACDYRIGRSTVCNIIKETCKALWTTLQPIYLISPQCANDWKLIAQG